MKPVKTFYYSDELSDDFASTQSIHACHVADDFPYIRKNPFWNIAAFILYRLIVTPLVWLFCKIGFGLRIRGKKRLRGLRGGYYLYANHTQHAADAFIPSLVAFPRKTYIVTGADAVSVPGLRAVVQMLGAIPLPTHAKGLPHLADAMRTRLREGSAICIFPEAHIWPYYTHIRPFRSGSFAYPVRDHVPAVPYVVTYRERKVLKFLWPCITVYIGDPIYPDGNATERAERQRLRDEAYRFMHETAEGIPQPEHIKYIKKEP